MNSELKNEHITQIAVGSMLTGDAGFTKKQIKDGYCIMLCTMNKEGRFVDIALTKKQVEDLIDNLK
ncbi:MAG: hypothetical protein KAS32_03790 [Candidatus Peribacteraceae bacterium]|nr:hypothetical protein [Candidatus Peribacteraceae bacterium]